MMNNTWILVAHRGGARLFENKGPGKGLNLLHDIPHPAGRLKNKEIGADKPGRSFDSRGQSRHSLSTEQEPTAHVTEQFAKQLSTMLDDGRRQQLYGKLVLVAEPRFLGSLRARLERTHRGAGDGDRGKGPGGRGTAQYACTSDRHHPALSRAAQTRFLPTFLPRG